MTERSFTASDLLSALARGKPLADGPELSTGERFEGVDRVDLANALFIGDRLTNLQQRQKVIEALYRTAVDLTSLDNVNEVLHAIVSRARELVSADVSYITLLDPEIGGTRVRATVGTTSADFEDLTLQPGAGLGGKVVETGAPVLTSNYLHDVSLSHVPQNDAATAAERLQSMLGVPLRAGQHTLGVLFVANRSPLVFAEQDVELLSSLAAHAAIAVANAQLYEEARSAAEQLEAARGTISRHAEELERDLSDHSRLAHAVLRRETLAHVVARAASILDGDLAITSPTGTMLAKHVVTESDGALQHLLGSGMPEQIRGVDTEVFETEETGGGRGCGFAAPLAVGGEILGYAYAWLSGDRSAAQLPAVQRAFLVLSFAVMAERFERQYQERSLAHFFDYLASTEPGDEKSVSAVAEGFGLETSAYSHICVWTGSGLAPSVPERLSGILMGSGFKAAPHGHGVVALVPTGHRPEAVNASVDAGDVALTCGFADLRELGWTRALREAKACADALVALDRFGEVADCTELGLFGVLAGDLGQTSVRRIMEGDLDVLLSHDRRHGTVLVDTVDAWFASNHNHARTARRLHVHVNTLYRRMARVEELLGAEWDAGDRGLELRVAIRFWRFAS